MAANLETAHQALQKLKNQPAALKHFHDALNGLSSATGLDYGSDELSYVGKTLVDQREIPQNKSLASKPGVTSHNGFFIKPSVE